MKFHETYTDYDHGVIMYVKFLEDVVRHRSYCPLIALISMNLCIQSHNLETNGCNFMKLILNIYGHGMVMHISL